MRAFHNDPKIAAKYRARVAAHAAADEIIKGVYWEKGKGCAVGCTVHASNHAAYESELGIPIALAYLEDAIFEGLPIQLARTWPKRFLAAPSVGADLSLVQWRFFYWLCTQRKFGAFHDPLVTGAVSACAKVMKRLINGEKPIDVRLAAQKAKDAANAAAAYAAANAAIEAAAYAAAHVAERKAQARIIRKYLR